MPSSAVPTGMAEPEPPTKENESPEVFHNLVENFRAFCFCLPDLWKTNRVRQMDLRSNVPYQ